MSVGVVTGNYDLLRSWDFRRRGGVAGRAGWAWVGLGRRWAGHGPSWDGWDDVSGGGCGSGGLDGLGGQG